MSLGLVVNHSNQNKKMSESQYVADLAGLFERRRIAIGDAHVCEQFEILLTTSEAFRGQLFTLCMAISHMSESDLSGEELLDLIARALCTETGEGASLPDKLRKSLLSGLDEWNSRSLSSGDEWPVLKKPVVSVAETSASEHRAEPAPSVPARPAGLRTVQEALELVRSRSLEQSLHPEPVPRPPSASGAASEAAAQRLSPAAPAGASAMASVDPNATTIEELNALLAEIEERMKRLRPQLGTTDIPVSPTLPVAPQILTTEEREAAFLKRHSYLRSDRPRPAFEIEEHIPTIVEKPVPALQATPAEVTVSDSELRLVPRSPTEEEEEPGPPELVIPDALRFKTYLAIAVLAGVALVATPISGVIAYRYMHPMYIYETPKPPAPPPLEPSKAADTGKPAGTARRGAQGKSSRTHKAQPVGQPSSVSVWPPPPHRQ
jgi:hypothetical protein